MRPLDLAAGAEDVVMVDRVTLEAKARSFPVDLPPILASPPFPDLQGRVAATDIADHFPAFLGRSQLFGTGCRSDFGAFEPHRRFLIAGIPYGKDQPTAAGIDRQRGELRGEPGQRPVAAADTDPQPMPGTE